MRSLAIFGAGGLGREVVDSCAGPWVLVDDQHAGANVRGARVLGRDDLPPGSPFVVAIGDGTVRRQIVSEVVERNWVPSVLIDARAALGSDVQTAGGVVVRTHATVTTSVTLGRFVIVNINATIGHDCVLDDFATVMPGAHLSGSVHLGEEVLVGTGAVVLPGVTIGARAKIGAGAVVTADVPAETTVVGVPARVR